MNPIVRSITILAVLVCVATQVTSQTNRRWLPANYKGLIPGKSTASDVIKILGKPLRKDIPEGDSKAAPEVWFIYDREGDIPGQFTVAIAKRTNRVLWLELAPNNLTKEAAIKHFGADYILTRYEACPGDEYIESGPIYESPNGNAVYIEYPSDGIAMFIGYKDLISNILYLKEQVGLKSLAEYNKRKSSRRG